MIIFCAPSSYFKRHCAAYLLIINFDIRNIFFINYIYIYIYSLCLQEKLQIVRRSRKSTGGEFLNRRSEIEGTCRHRTNFHRLRVREDTTVATDERTCLVVPTDITIREKVSEVKESMERCSIRARALRARMRSKRA